MDFDKFDTYTRAFPKFSMDVLKGKTLLSFDGRRVAAEKALKGMNTLVYYFSASWCDARVNLLPKMKQIFKVSTRNNPPPPKPDNTPSGIGLGKLHSAPPPGNRVRFVRLRRGHHDGGLRQEPRLLVRHSFRRRRNLVANPALCDKTRGKNRLVSVS